MSGETELMIAGGVESMSRAPFIMPKADSSFSRNNAVYDTHSMPQTADNVATDFNMSPEDHMGLNLSAFRMLEVKNGNWALVK